ncbi:MAG: hypothetical protein ACRDN9_16650 [Streptosporangiaceae bacterium]
MAADSGPGPRGNGAAARDDAANGSAFQRTFDEPLERFLDLDTWHSGADLTDVYARLQRDLETSVDEAVREEDTVAATLREHFFHELKTGARRRKPPLAGRWAVGIDDIERVHKGALFTGDVEACDGVVQVHDSLALTVLQFGVGLIGYRGNEGTWSSRLFRRDLSGGPPDAYEEAMKLLAERDRGAGDSHGEVVELGRRGLATFAQRAVLARRSTARWRMGKGSPAPYELLTGSGAMRLVEPAVEVLRELLLGHRQFVFVPYAQRQRGLLTIGNALRPLEFAVVHLLRSEIEDVVEQGHLRGRQREVARAFVEDAGSHVAIGVFRASRTAPPRVFYAPAERELCAQAATIALADAVLQEHRGYPLLLDMARHFCGTAFGRAEFEGPIQAAYAAHDHAIAYLSEM